MNEVSKSAPGWGGKLPKGWTWFHLEDVVKLYLEDVPPGSKLLLSVGDTEVWIRESIPEESPRFPIGTVFVVLPRRLLLTKAVLVPFQKSTIRRDKNGPQINPEYLAYWLTGAGPILFKSFGRDRTSLRGNEPFILRKFGVPLPSIVEQQLAVAKYKRALQDSDKTAAALKCARRRFPRIETAPLEALARGNFMKWLLHENKPLAKTLRPVLTNSPFLAGKRGASAQKAIFDIVAACINVAEQRLTKQIGDGFGEVLESVKAKRTSESGQDDMQGYVTLYQAAKIVCRSKRTLEKIKDLPLPNVEGGGGKTAFWAWDEMRPWLELHFGMKLPKKFPKHIPPRPPVLSADSDDDPGEPAEEPAVTKGKPKSPPKPDWETGHYQCKSSDLPTGRRLDTRTGFEDRPLRQMLGREIRLSDSCLQHVVPGSPTQ